MLQRWDPFNELRRMEDTMNRLWRGFAGNDQGVANGGESTTTWMMPLDVVEEEDRVVVRASIPGIDPENLDVSVEGRLLTIRGEASAHDEKKGQNYLIRERRSGSFHRAIRLPEYADADKAESSYEHGVLTVTLPKVEAKRPKQIEIKVGR